MSLTDISNVATIVTGLASVVTSVAAFWLGYQVYRLTRDTDRWQKFDRRLAIYQATKDYLVGIVMHGTTANDTSTNDWWRAVKGYNFLFHRDVQKLIEDTFDDGDRLDAIRRRLNEPRDYGEDAKRAPLEEEREKIFDRVQTRFTNMDKLFGSLLTFHEN